MTTDIAPQRATTNLRASRDRVARARRDAGDTPWLIGYDANGIQSFITASGRPISMRGASAVIDEFDSAVKAQPHTVFAGGGRGLCLVRSESEAKALAHKLTERYQRDTGHGVLATAWVPLNRDAEAASCRWLRHRLDIAKDEAPTPLPALATQRDLECSECHRYRSTRTRNRRDVDGAVIEEPICQRCFVSSQRGRDAGRDEGSARSEMSQSLQEIARRADGSVGSIAAVSADGNELGALFDSLDSLDALATISDLIAALFTGAHERALAPIPSPQRLSLVIGGDDVRAYMAPGWLLDYVAELARALEDSAAKAASDLPAWVGGQAAELLGHVGIGVGAVVADVYFPAWRLMEYAHALELHAKAKRADARSVFDVAVMMSEAQVSAGMTHGRSERDRRPLALDTASWQKTLTVADALAAVPSSQRSLLATADDVSEAEFANLLRYQVARSRPWQTFFEHCDVDWHDPEAVIAHRPDAGLLELVRLRELARKTARQDQHS